VRSRTLRTFAARDKEMREPDGSLFYFYDMDIVQQIKDWLSLRLGEAEYQAYFLIEVRVIAGNKVEVYLDGDEGIDLAACRDFSRYLEALLDEGGQLGEDYTLEVSSPGATRPLILPRQYPKHVGRTLELTLANGDKVEGKLLHTTENAFGLEVNISPKGRKKELAERLILYADIRESKVKLAFK
jgi:ribosome maturation factor RimP